MTWFWYGVDFTWNKILGRSILQNPIETIGIIIILFILVFGCLATLQLFQNYRKTQRIPTLYFAIGLALYLVAAVLLIIERICLAILGLADLGTFMAVFALSAAGTAGVFSLRFIFLTSYPEQDKILTLIVAIGEALSHGCLCFAIILGPPFANLINYEIVYAPFVNIIFLCLIIPLIVIGVGTFFIYAYKLRIEDKPNSIRTFWLGTGILIFFLGLLGELVPIFPEILSIPFRSLMLMGTLITYICFLMPKWFKDKIGWKE